MNTSNLKYTIRQKLKSSKKTVMDLAIDFGVHYATANLWTSMKINDEKSIKSETLLKLSSYFDCSVEDLYNPQYLKLVSA